MAAVEKAIPRPEMLRQRHRAQRHRGQEQQESSDPDEGRGGTGRGTGAPPARFGLVIQSFLTSLKAMAPQVSGCRFGRVPLPVDLVYLTRPEKETRAQAGQ